MNKKKKSKIEARKKVFDNIKIGKKEILLKKRIKSSRQSISKSSKIMKDVNYGKDLDYQQYMLYLDKLREKQEMDLKYNSEKDKNDNTKDKIKLLRKRISFSDFSNKFKVNPHLINYFDYYDIQKINRKEVERYLKEEEEKNNNNNQIKTESDFKSETDEEKEKDKNVKSFKTIQTDSGYEKNKYGYLFSSRLESKKNNKRLQKKYKKLNLSGVDFNLINKISTETLKVNKEIEHLNFMEELKKEKEKIYKNIAKNVQISPEEEKDKKIINNEIENMVDQYSIFHSVEAKSVRKLKRLKLKIDKKIDQHLAPQRKLSKTIYQNTPTYFTYIPNSAKYKDISCQKDCLFNKEFKTIKARQTSHNKFKNIKTHNSISNIHHINKINNLIKTQKNNFTNKEAYFLTTNENILTKSNNIIGDLKDIKLLLKKDRNYTSKTINRASSNYFKSRTRRQDRKLMEKIMKENVIDYSKIEEMRKKRKNKDEEQLNIFNLLKQVDGGFERDNKFYPNVHILFSKSLNSLCREEKNENKEYNFIIKNHYHLKLESDEMKQNVKNIKDNIEQKQILVNILNLKIHEKCEKINDIISQSGKNSE